MSDTSESTPRPPRPAAVDDPRIQAMRQLVGVIDRLREPDGCPWDREQTETSMGPSLIEEAHEWLEAIEVGGADQAAEEAGDTLMNVLMICRIAQEDGRYDLARAAGVCAEKLVRRHPHVFGDAQADTAQEVLTSWEAIKRREREDRQEDASALAGIPRALPALQRAARTCSKSVSSGFHWNDVRGALAKVREELGELECELPGVALEADYKPRLEEPVRARVEHELGDLLLATAYLGQYLGLDPERLCRAAVRRFERRFRRMEGEIEGPPADHDLDTLMAAWGRAKDAED